MTTLNNLQINDEYYTSKEVWMNILHYLDRDKIYLDPFYVNGSNIENLKELGLNCIGADIDCFELLQNMHFDCILTNSPFSKNILVPFLYNLEALNKSFVIILPIQKIACKYFRTAFRSYKDIQIIIPKERLSFTNPRLTNNKSNPSFVCCYVCYKMDLPSDIIFL